jgi:hypothetical protein
MRVWHLDAAHAIGSAHTRGITNEGEQSMRQPTLSRGCCCWQGRAPLWRVAAPGVLRARRSIQYAAWVDTAPGPGTACLWRLPALACGVMPCFHEVKTVTEPVERPLQSPLDTPAPVPHTETRPDPVETQHAVQQLREAGFSEDQQVALTTALLRVLALWTQQATRGDLQTAVQAGAQRLAQQLDTLREDLRRAMAQQAEALREEVRRAVAQQADVLATTRAASIRQRDVPRWLLLVLLGLTCVGVLLLVLFRVLGW